MDTYPIKAEIDCDFYLDFLRIRTNGFSLNFAEKKEKKKNMLVVPYQLVVLY